jgi:hypothetical protein
MNGGEHRGNLRILQGSEPTRGRATAPAQDNPQNLNQQHLRQKARDQRAAGLPRTNFTREEMQRVGKRGELRPAFPPNVHQVWQMPKACRRALELIEAKLPADDSGQGATPAKVDRAVCTLVLQNAFEGFWPATGDVA